MRLKIQDLLSADRKASLHKTDAHYWIATSEDFEQICWWAGWEPDNVRYRYYKALKSGDIKFKENIFFGMNMISYFKDLKLKLMLTLVKNLDVM